MTSAIADAGPVLHLHEIDQIDCLKVFDHLSIPDLVAQELRGLQLDLSHVNISIAITTIQSAEWNPVIGEVGKPIIHPADAQIFALARSRQFQEPVLTDDLALRRHLESAGATVVGTVGILVRGYSSGRLTRTDLDNAVELLFTVSTLHTSRAFKTYVQTLLSGLS